MNQLAMHEAHLDALDELEKLGEHGDNPVAWAVAEITRLNIKLDFACDEGKKLQTENERLRELSAVVVKAWEASDLSYSPVDVNDPVDVAIDNLRVEAGIPAPAKGGDDA